MAKTDGGDVPTPASSAPAGQTGPAAQPAGPTVTMDAEHLQPIYSNFARVTGSPEELILDFGLNTQPFGAQAQEVRVSQRLVMNFFTAKRLLGALHMAIQRHEQAFGVLETDVNKRVMHPGTPRQQH